MKTARKLIAGSALVVGVLAIPTAAWAHDCVNLSRQPDSDFQSQGRWVFVPESASGVPGGFWAFDNPAGFAGNSGHGDALLDGTGACSEARLSGQTHGSMSVADAKGIWSEDCYVDAGGIEP
jgi:hypothetical protein